MKIPFLGQAYASRAPTLASQTLVNLYAEMTEGNSDEPGAFYGTPGLIKVFQGSGEVRGLHAAGGALYGVIGNTVYRSFAGIVSSLGVLPNSTGLVSMIHNETQVAIAHSSGWHWVAFSGSAIAPVAGAPDTSILAFQDEYGLYTDTGGLFGLSQLADLSTLDPLDVADAESQPDNLVAILSDHKEAWLFGESTIEIWDDTGAALFPFEPAPGGFIEQGCCSPRSVRKMDNGNFWVGQDDNGRGIVYRSNGYQPVRISTHPIETLLNSCSDLSQVFAWGYQEEGHTFYCLTAPLLGDGSGDFTVAYDAATKGWHRRGWMDSQGILRRHRANCCEYLNGIHYVGDFENGKVYRMSLDAYTDDGDVIYRERAFDIPDSDQKKVRIDKIELHATTGEGGGVAAQATWTADSSIVTADSSATADGSTNDGSTEQLICLEVSRDSGRRFGYKRNLPAGDIGKTVARLRWRRAGSGRNIVLRFSTTMTNRVQWVGALMDAQVLN